MKKEKIQEIEKKVKEAYDEFLEGEQYWNVYQMVDAHRTLVELTYELIDFLKANSPE